MTQAVSIDSSDLPASVRGRRNSYAPEIDMSALIAAASRPVAAAGAAN